MKATVSLSSAEFGQRVVKVKLGYAIVTRYYFLKKKKILKNKVISTCPAKCHLLKFLPSMLH